MLLKKILCSLLFLILYNNLLAQITISGNIVDSTQVGVPFAQVLLCRDDSSHLVLTYTQADNNGKYKMNVDLGVGGPFIIIFRSIGYAEYKEEIWISTSSVPQTIAVPTVQLVRRPFLIENVCITRTRPVTYKKDTMIYSIDAFVTGNEQVAEDVLKRLPGLSVEDDGKIKFKGKEVEKIMIENDDLFGKGYQLVSKNLHASAIDKVEVYSHYSEEEMLRNVEKSDKIAINLKLGEDSRLRPFGNVSMGYTTDRRHDAKINIMSLGKRVKLYLFGNSNQLGYSPLNDLNQFYESLFQNQFNPPKQRFSLSISLPELNRKYVRFNTSNLISCNTIIKPTKRVNIKVTSFIMREDDTYNRNSTYTYTLPNASFMNTENYGIRSQDLSGYLNIEMSLKHSLNSQTKYKCSFGKECVDEYSNLIFNLDSTKERLHSYFIYTNHYIGYTRKCDSTNVLKIDANFHYSKRPENYHVNLLPFDDSLAYSLMASSTKQNLETSTKYISVKATMLNRLKESILLSTSLGTSSTNNSISSNTYAVNENLATTLPDLYTGRCSLQQTKFFVGEKASFQFSEKISISGSATYYALLSEKEIERTGIQSKNYFYLEPSLNAEWKSNKNIVQLGCAINTSTTSIAEVYNRRVVEGYRNISMGLDHFFLFKGYSIIGNYQRGSWLSSSFLNIIFIYNHNPKYLGSNNIISPNTTLTTYIINNNQNLFVLNLTSDHFLRPIRNNIKILLNITSSTYSNWVNGVNTPCDYYGGNIGLEFRSVFKCMFNYHIGSKINYSNVNNTKSHSNMQFVDLYLNINKNLSVTAKGERYYFNEINGKDNPIYFFDIGLKYNAIANRLSFIVEAINLLNNSNYQTYNVTNTQKNNLSYRLVPRNLKLSLNMRF